MDVNRLKDAFNELDEDSKSELLKQLGLISEQQHTEQMNALREELTERFLANEEEMSRHLQVLRFEKEREQHKSDEWWLQAQQLRAAIVAHFLGELTDEQLYQRSREAWQWPSFGNEIFDETYSRSEINDE